MTKTCYYVEKEGRFRWYLPDDKDTPACKCIMSVAEGKTVQLNELNRLFYDGVITDKELDSIYRFDGRRGLDKDLEIIKKLAKRIKVELVRK